MSDTICICLLYTSPADHNHLLVDDKVAHVVREIFDLALAGNGISKIRKHINKQHVLRPAAYAVEQGATGYEVDFEDNEENRYIWSENSVCLLYTSGLFSALSIISDWRKKEWHTTTDGRTGNGVSGKKRRKSCCVSAALMKRPLSRYALRTGQTSIPTEIGRAHV